MKKLVLILSAISILNTTFSQEIDVKNIEILRDSYGVPHIYAKTDAELAYGLAWAHSEDDFKTIQEAYLAGNGLLSKYIGLRGAPADFLTQLIRSDYVVDSLYNTIDKNFIIRFRVFCMIIWYKIKIEKSISTPSLSLERILET